MRTERVLHRYLILVVIGWSIFLAFDSSRAWAHCDTENGPVATDARKALEKERFELVAVWVSQKQHQELYAVFKEAAAVYQRAKPFIEIGRRARNLAERYFLETAIRLHLQSRGLPYSGLQPSQSPSPAVKAAQEALETGDPGPLSKLLGSEAEGQQKLQHLFARVREAHAKKSDSLTAGRKWADAYVTYMTYVNECAPK